MKPISTNNGAYCQARQRLPEKLLTRLVQSTGQQLHDDVPEEWLWHGRPVKLGDGSTVSMPDTPENTDAFGKPANQKGGGRFPVARIVVILCLATGAAMEMAIGRCGGKGTGELSLFRTLLDSFSPGDVLLADRFFCTYCDIAQLQSGGVDVVMRQHSSRKSDFRRGTRLGKDDHVVLWNKPRRCPQSLDRDVFASLPETLTLREVRVRLEKRGYRTKSLVLVTTLTDATEFPKADIEDLYRQRWHVEVDLRSIKDVLQMDVLRCETPEMVRKEMWVHLLAWNLLRSVMCSASDHTDVAMRKFSFKGTKQLLMAMLGQLTTSVGEPLSNLVDALLTAVQQHRVGNRPNRSEPRKRKRPPKPYPALKQPRDVERKLCD
jgi:hypothetical protein